MDNANTILVVEDENDMAAVLKKRLSDAGNRVFHALDGRDALEKVKELNPNLILLDVVMPIMNGMQVKAELNKNEITARIPVIFLTAKAKTDDKIEGLRLRADDYITKPFNWDELHARIDVLLYKDSYYQQLSLQDDLTGLPNAKFFKTQLASVFDIAKKYGRVFSLAVLDINDFKRINDHFGHQAGDKVLRETALIMNNIIRKPDILARYGGDEFVIIFSECDLVRAKCALSRLRDVFQKLQIVIPPTNGIISISLSAGVAAYTPEISDSKELFELADRNMYEDKLTKKRTSKKSEE
ncbi:MAG: diguanylate cyclase [Candidatus Omnitrophica bacterium]|nr:diguanylate cyclase [Candidatus Omnitrophota bacterium]